MADAPGGPMKVVMCHGTFDLLHAGHVAHLQEARAMGDFLVVGITADAYVQKGSGRPVVPAVDRAQALRALRCVDWVAIDPSPTPKELIEAWKPALFVKGADYAGQDLPEQAWVARCGGEVRFTQGATMYHSRQWLHPDVRAALIAADLSPTILLAILDAAPGVRIHVVGDLIVDEYVQGELIGPLTLRVGTTQRWVGGAGAVALHAAGAGAQVHLTAPWGEDALGTWAEDRLDAAGVVMTSVATAQSPRKVRYYSDRGLLCQIDHVDSTPLTAASIDLLAGCVRAVRTDAVICADYRHGVFHADSLPVLRAALPKEALWVADSQVASRWGNISDFENFNLITPNEREARWALGEQDTPVPVLALDLLQRGAYDNVLLTRGAEGVYGMALGSTAFTVPALAAQVVDSVGAGDALLAYATVALKVTGSLVQAAWLGSVAAAIACSRQGNAPVLAAEVREWLEHV